LHALVCTAIEVDPEIIGVTELIWDGKYKDGKKQGPVRIALPFQTIETVNESAQDRRRNLELFAGGRDTEWRNRLIWGDKKYVLPSLLPEFAGKVNLIYIDPPFNTDSDFSFTATIPSHAEGEHQAGAAFIKRPSILEQLRTRSVSFDEAIGTPSCSTAGAPDYEFNLHEGSVFSALATRAELS
jgi:hypothetical protein